MIKKQKKNSVEVWKKNCTSGLDIIKKNGSENLTILLLIKAGKFVCPFRNLYKIQGGPPLTQKSVLRFPLQWYVTVGDFRMGWGPPTVPPKRISCNTVYSESQNARKAGTLCSWLSILVVLCYGIFGQVTSEQTRYLKVS